MAPRIAAIVVLLAVAAAVAWVAFGRDANEASPAAAGDSAGSTTATPTAVPTPPSSESPTTSIPDSLMAGVAEAPADGADAPPTTAEPTPEPDVDKPENYGPRMDLVELDGWLNTDAAALEDFDGQVLLVEMWTFGCHNCKARIPYNQSYYQEFAGENFEIIGVHAPEFSYEADVANIEAALVDLGVTWPVALDTNKKNFRAWQPGSTNYWPRTYVIDQNGDIRYDHIGEGKYEELRETIRYLIENPPAPAAS